MHGHFSMEIAFLTHLHMVGLVIQKMDHHLDPQKVHMLSRKFMHFLGQPVNALLGKSAA